MKLVDGDLGDLDLINWAVSRKRAFERRVSARRGAAGRDGCPKSLMSSTWNDARFVRRHCAPSAVQTVRIGAAERAGTAARPCARGRR